MTITSHSHEVVYIASHLKEKLLKSEGHTRSENLCPGTVTLKAFGLGTANKASAHPSHVQRLELWKWEVSGPKVSWRSRDPRLLDEGAVQH